MSTRFFALAVSFLASLSFAQGELPDAYDVVWETPSTDASGSMPLGNGVIGLNAWFEPDGELVFYIGRTDSWGDNGRLLKVGKVRVALDPNPYAEGMPFEQRLRLRDATMAVRIGEGEDAVTVELWVDAKHPIIEVRVQSPTPIAATASIEPWRTELYELPTVEVSDVLLDRSREDQQHAPTVVEPDLVLSDLPDAIGWLHHNTKSVGPALTAEVQGLDGFERTDPLLHRTFGAIVYGDDVERVDAHHLRSSPRSDHRFAVTVHTLHPGDPEEWVAKTRSGIEEVEGTPYAQRRAAHEESWRNRWARSWIDVTSTSAPTAPPMIPDNDYPIRIGEDQEGGNRFVGTIEKLFIKEGSIIAHLRDEAVRQYLEESPELPSTAPGSDAWNLYDGIQIFARITPGDLPAGGGRILDKITPGKSDGFLFDTYPGHSLRLICGSRIVHAKDVLPRDRTVDVAAVADGFTGELTLWVDKELVATSSTDDPLDDAFVVSRAYALQRFIDLAGGLGAYPIKFNGAIFTVPYADRPGDADYRRWGPGYWWQNTRLPYLSMCASGDIETLDPLFRMYGGEVLELSKYRTRHYFGHGGAFFPECVYFWGDCFSESYGWTPFEERGEDKLQVSGWHKWEWVAGPELVWMMLDRWEHTLDERFLADMLLPAAHETLTFFDEHYELDEAGKLVMHPSQSLETWWECTGPMPEIAGLHAVLARLLAIPEESTTEQERAFWRALLAKLPELPLHEVDGVRMLAPAHEFADKRNIENPELYAVFPFRLVSFEKENRELGIQALRHRADRGNFGWRQDDLFMAYLGLADEARENLVGRARNSDEGSRFPAFWGPNYDWIPDQDHGGVLMRTLQVMLMQTEGKAIHLLPAWPKDWDVSFKLHAPYQTVVQGEYRDGKIQALTVTPEDRRGDVVFAPGIQMAESR